jgi:DNA-binding LacI/PurR family transcriptional regulator
MSSILDVAREARVAPSTVSLVANQKGRVSESTRQRVQAVMERLGYSAGRPRKRSRQIAVVYTPNMLVNGMLVEYCRTWIKGIQRGFDGEGTHVNIMSGAAKVDEDPLFLQGLEADDFCGAILMGAYRASGYVQRCVERKLPLVVFNQLPQECEFSAVRNDVGAGCRMVIHRMVELGHRRIATISTLNTSHHELAHRGMTEALAQHGLKSVIDRVERDAPELAAQIIAQRATAVFAGDPLALKLANELNRRGIDVPGQVSIVGIDDMGLVTDRGLRLTSLGYDKNVMGEMAGTMLRQLIDLRDRLTNLVAAVPMHLVEGQTLAAPPR